MEIYSHCQIAKIDNEWQVATWLFREDKTIYCRSIISFTSRKAAREFQSEQRIRFSPPEIYLGTGI
jgi:hypothetical protein